MQGFIRTGTMAAVQRALSCIFVLLFLGVSGLITDENQARRWLDEYNAKAQDIISEAVSASWNYNTNLTDHNQKIQNAVSLKVTDFNAAAVRNASRFGWKSFQNETIKRLFSKCCAHAGDAALNNKTKIKRVEKSVMRAEFDKEAGQNASLYDWKKFKTEALKREFMKVSDIGSAALKNKTKLERLNMLRADMSKTYSTARVCRDNDKTRCHPLDPDLTDILAKSTDYNELAWAWKGWRDESGKKMKSKYKEFVDLSNEAARENGYQDNGDYWRSKYETDDFQQQCQNLYEQLKPLYQNLHAYVKAKLMDQYGRHNFPLSGHIPAHILGNMWAQSWNNIYPRLIPYPNKKSIDVTKKMQELGYTAEKMFEVSEEFFTSLGLIEMPERFWNYSMIEKPKDRDVVCHASAWDFYNQKDFRIKQCSEISMEWLIVTHHEMGHVEYFLQYKELPVKFRGGANPGFHEAVGDVLSLSVATPKHLEKIGLLDKVDDDDEADLNFLMSQALSKIAFLPFGYLIDQWRWSVFDGSSPINKYNEKWWELRCKYQGVSPPVKRSEDDFDPGAKYHIPGNTPYIRYFVSFIIQFQFHEALCKAANQTGPLHRCDIYRSKEAGKLLGDMLKMGSSQPWPEAMEAITGQRKMDASAIMNYFQPLTDWLKMKNAGKKIDWIEKCGEEKYPNAAAASVSLGVTTFLVTAMAMFWNSYHF